jgi:hypothetical protein
MDIVLHPPFAAGTSYTSTIPLPVVPLTPETWAV